MQLDPDLILPVVLPPLLIAATQRATVREFRDNAGAVLFLAVGLTLVTMVAVGIVAHGYGLPWWPALMLGAMVSPPDPVAATAVARKLRLPHRLVTILEVEGMFNDATALVAFKVTLAAVVTGEVSAAGIGVELVVGLAAGVVVGLVLAALAKWVLSFADFLITSLVFAILGYELVEVVDQTNVTHHAVVLAVMVVATLLVVRAVWVFASTLVARRRARRREVTLPQRLA